MGTDIVVADRNAIAALNPNSDALQALLYNIQVAGGVDEKDIRRVKNPSGGGLMFEIENPNGDPDYVRELIGIPMMIMPRRVLWADKAIGSKAPPVCTSNDCLNGVKRRNDAGAVDIPQNILDIGIPGGTEGKCAGCPFDEWGSAVNDKGEPMDGKRCQEQRIVYFLRTGDVLPVKLSVPAGSLDGFKKAIKSIPVRVDQAVIKLFLVKEKSKANIEFAAYRAELVSKLDAESVDGLNKFRDLFVNVFKNATAERTDEKAAERGARRRRTGGDVPEDHRF